MKTKYHDSRITAAVAHASVLADIQGRLERLTKEYAGLKIECPNWGDVGSLRHVNEALKEISDSVFNEGEYAPENCA